MLGVELENLVEDLLIKYNYSYVREGERINYGHKAREGKYDFEVHGITAIECKVKDKQNKLTIPGLSSRTHKAISKPMIKTHQLKALRAYSEQVNNDTYIVAYIEEENRFYAITEREIEQLVARDIYKRNLKDEMTEINLDEFIKNLKENEDEL